MPGLTVIDDGVNQDARFLLALFASAPFSPVDPGNTDKALVIDALGNIVPRAAPSGGGGSSVSVPIGAMVAFHISSPFPEMTIGTSVWLRSGYTATIADYPPAVDIGGGTVGSFFAAAADFPDNQYPYYVRVT